MSDTEQQTETVERDKGDTQRLALQRRRSIALAVSLCALAVLFYIVTLVKMGGVLEKAGS